MYKASHESRFLSLGSRLMVQSPVACLYLHVRGSLIFWRGAMMSLHGPRIPHPPAKLQWHGTAATPFFYTCMSLWWLFFAHQNRLLSLPSRSSHLPWCPEGKKRTLFCLDLIWLMTPNCLFLSPGMVLLSEEDNWLLRVSLHQGDNLTSNTALY